jgi:hypothetical protein
MNFSRPLRGTSQQPDPCPPRTRPECDFSSLSTYSDSTEEELQDASGESVDEDTPPDDFSEYHSDDSLGPDERDFDSRNPNVQVNPSEPLGNIPVVNQSGNENHTQPCDFDDNELPEQRDSSTVISNTQLNLREIAAHAARLELRCATICRDPMLARQFDALYGQERQRIIIREWVNRTNSQTQPAPAPVPFVHRQDEVGQSKRDSMPLRKGEESIRKRTSRGVFEAIAKVNERRQSKRDSAVVRRGRSEKRTTPPQHGDESTRERESRRFWESITKVTTELEGLWGDGTSDGSEAESKSPKSQAAQAMGSCDQAPGDPPSSWNSPDVPDRPSIQGQLGLHPPPVFKPQLGNDVFGRVAISQPALNHNKHDGDYVLNNQTPENPYPSPPLEAVKNVSLDDFGSVDDDAPQIPAFDVNDDERMRFLQSWRDL